MCNETAGFRIFGMVTCVLGVLLVLPIAGCGTPDLAVEPVPAYVASPEAIWGLKRVVLVELDSRDAPAELARDFSQSVRLAVQSRRVFPVDFAAAGEPLDTHLAGCRGPRLTLKQLVGLRKQLRCDAVMVGSVTAFEPYPDARLGVQIWLVDLRSGKLLWGVEHAWCVGDPATAEKMERYFDYPGCEDSESAVRLAEMSPRGFGDFVAWDLARSLPLPPGVAETSPRRDAGEHACDTAKNIMMN